MAITSKKEMMQLLTKVNHERKISAKKIINFKLRHDSNNKIYLYSVKCFVCWSLIFIIIIIIKKLLNFIMHSIMIFKKIKENVIVMCISKLFSRYLIKKNQLKKYYMGLEVRFKFNKSI